VLWQNLGKSHLCEQSSQKQRAMQPLKRMAVSVRPQRYIVNAAQSFSSPVRSSLHSTNGNALHYQLRAFSTSTMIQDPFKPAARVAGQRQDVWSIVNEAAGAYQEENGAGSMINLGTIHQMIEQVYETRSQ